MATKHQHCTLIHTPELSLSDSEDSYSSSEEDMPEREETDRLLRQAHHYVITEGGNDSPATYMKRMHRINRSLIQEISKHSYECDPKLYRRVKQKVDHVLREFEDTVDADSSVYDFDEMPENYTVAPEEALYRKDPGPVTPDGVSALRTTKCSGKDDLERTYLYGGPYNHPENWYKNAAASLPFPETIRMAGWESLRIHWDLATTGDMEMTEPVISNGVSFNNSRLAHHDSLAQYESGSRFKLPAIDPIDMAKVNKLGTVDQLHKAVHAFGQHDDTRTENGDYKCAPRVFLETLDVGQQGSLTDRKLHSADFLEKRPANITAVIDQVGGAVNTTPTEACLSNRGSSKIGPAPPATRTLLDKQQQTSVSSPENDTSSQTIKADHNDDIPTTISSPDNIPSHRTVAPESFSINDHDVSPAIRRIKAATEASIRSSILPQSPPAYPETTHTQVATRISIPAKRPHGRPRENPLPTPTDLTVSVYQTTATDKRKRLSVNVVEEELEVDAEVETVPAKRTRITKQSPRPYTTTTATKLENLHTPAMTPAATPALTVSGSSVASMPPVVKARAAGKKQKRIRTKRNFEERVTPEKYAEIMAQRGSVTAQRHESVAKGSTRSGKLRAT